VVFHIEVVIQYEYNRLIPRLREEGRVPIDLDAEMPYEYNAKPFYIELHMQYEYIVQQWSTA
jgi:hypothetical protein